MRIRDDVLFISLNNEFMNVNNSIKENIQKLSSGLKINTAADDASGMVICEKMRSQIRALDQAYDNIQDGISLVQTAEAGYNSISNILQRMNELSIKACNGVMTEDDREKIELEFNQCVSEIDRIANTITFNGKKLLAENLGKIEYQTEYRTEGSVDAFAVEIGIIDLESATEGNVLIVKNNHEEYRFEFDSDGKKEEKGSILIDISSVETSEDKADLIKNAIVNNTNLRAIIYGSDENKKRLQIASKTRTEGEIIEVSTYSYAEKLKIGSQVEDELNIVYRAMDAKSLGINNLSLDTIEDANNSIDIICKAMSKVIKQRTEMGALQNRLEYNLTRVKVGEINMEAAKSRILDTDMADEIVKLTKNKVISSCIMPILASANRNRGRILALINN